MVGAFPHLFSRLKQVFARSVLCPAQIYSIRKSGSCGGNWLQSGQLAASRRPGEQVTGLDHDPALLPSP